ncbi:hypothetical protein GCWU000341_02685 [Oribacterium sp. oral taxon 078 str. F0262]|nr:hypothetical protein GCWU000341_02685 [Oribacterium sp. oral taxon 078 str. F0262]
MDIMLHFQYISLYISLCLLAFCPPGGHRKLPLPAHDFYS